MYLYEELLKKGIDPKKLPVDLCRTIPYNINIIKKIGIDNVTYKPVEVNKN